MLATEAEFLADLTDLAARPAGCFASARCAGCDVKALTPVARAALALGASKSGLYPDAPPYQSDTEYLDEVAEIRIVIRLRGQQVADIANRAVDQANQAAKAMRTALRQRPPDYAAYQLALWSYQDAVAAYEMCVETDDRLRRAYGELAAAAAAFGDTYELTERFVARGGVMPHEGRWITGERRPA
jgi:hypothetical protein